MFNGKNIFIFVPHLCSLTFRVVYIIPSVLTEPADGAQESLISPQVLDFGYCLSRVHVFIITSHQQHFSFHPSCPLWKPHVWNNQSFREEQTPDPQNVVTACEMHRCTFMTWQVEEFKRCVSQHTCSRVELFFFYLIIFILQLIWSYVVGSPAAQMAAPVRHSKEAGVSVTLLSFESIWGYFGGDLQVICVGTLVPPVFLLTTTQVPSRGSDQAIFLSSQEHWECNRPVLWLAMALQSH